MLFEERNRTTIRTPSTYLGHQSYCIQRWSKIPAFATSKWVTNNEYKTKKKIQSFLAWTKHSRQRQGIDRIPTGGNKKTAWTYLVTPGRDALLDHAIRTVNDLDTLEVIPAHVDVLVIATATCTPNQRERSAEGKKDTRTNSSGSIQEKPRSGMRARA